MEISNQLYVTSRGEWRSWLEENHDAKKEVWLIYYKKHTGKPSIPYDDTVEEALCFGWIDSIVKKIDDEKFARKLTPRKDRSKWSELNKKRARKMIEEGRMTEAGLARISVARKSGEWFKIASTVKTLEIPLYLKRALTTNKKALENFNNLSNTYKRHYVGWISSAKREETRKRRLTEAISLLEQNKKLGLK